MAPLSIPQLIQNIAKGAGVPPSLALQVARQESSLNPNATGSKGEIGLFQLMPGTSAALGVTDPYDPVQNAQAGVGYLAQLYGQFGSWDAALAAYNWGPQNVQNAMRTAGAGWLSLAPSSTQSYVAGALAVSGVQPSPPPAAAPAPAAQADQALPGSYVEYTSEAPAPAGPNLFVLALLGLGLYFGAQILFAE